MKRKKKLLKNTKWGGGQGVFQLGKEKKSVSGWFENKKRQPLGEQDITTG